MKTLYLAIIVIALILVIILFQNSFAELKNPLVSPSSSQECTDKIMAQEQAQDTPIDKDRTLFLVKNYPQFQSQTMGHNYTLNNIHHEFSVDSDACEAQVKDVVVEFVEKNPNGDSLITVTEDLGLGKVITLNVAKINNVPITTENVYYMTPVEPPNYGGLIFGIMISVGITAGVLFFLFKIRRKK